MPLSVQLTIAACTLLLLASFLLFAWSMCRVAALPVPTKGDSE